MSTYIKKKKTITQKGVILRICIWFFFFKIFLVQLSLGLTRSRPINQTKKTGPTFSTNQDRAQFNHPNMYLNRVNSIGQVPSRLANLPTMVVSLPGATVLCPAKRLKFLVKTYSQFLVGQGNKGKCISKNLVNYNIFPVEGSFHWRALYKNKFTSREEAFLDSLEKGKPKHHSWAKVKATSRYTT